MKKIVSIIACFALMLSVAILFSGCSTEKIIVESLLKIDKNFAGSRSVSFTFPKDVQTGDLESEINSACPKFEDSKDAYSVSMVTTTEYGKKYTFSINFSSQSDYIKKVTNLIGRDVSVYMAQPNSILTKGTRMTEDFDVKDITLWLTNIVAKNEATKDLSYNYSSNLVNVNGDIFTTDTTINVKDVSGYEINSLKIETTNNKNNNYERRFTFSIPEKTYNELGQSLKDYFAQNTDKIASYSDWVQKGTSYEYEVIYQNIDLDELKLVTNKMLDVNDCSVYYGDKTNSSTPLSEGLVFEEKLDLFSFMGKDKGPVKAEYKYSLPTTTTHSEGLVLDKGSWVTAGQWSEGMYTLNIDSSVMNIHIPDGIQYSIDGINISLVGSSDDKIIRTTDIMYDKKSGQNALNYAYNFFKAKYAKVSKEETDDNLICRIVSEGTLEHVSDETTKLFGGGNYLEYEKSNSFAEVAKNITIVDNINLGYMLTTENAKKPMNYTAIYGCSQFIKNVSVKGENISSKALKQTASDGSYTVAFNGVSRVYIDTAIPNISGIVFYSILSGLLIAGTIFFAIILAKKPQKESTKQHAPTQTTTFSISELSSLSEVMGKNKDKKSQNKDNNE